VAGHGGNQLTEKDLEEIRSGVKIKMLEGQFYNDEPGDYQSSIAESVNRSQPTPAHKYPASFVADMQSLRSLQPDERRIFKGLIKHLVEKKGDYLQLAKSLDPTSGSFVFSRQGVWKKIAEHMHQSHVTTAKATFDYKRDLEKILNFYESIAKNVSSKAEGSQHWPRYFGLIHDHLIDEEFLSRVCQIDHAIVTRLLQLKSKLNPY